MIFAPTENSRNGNRPVATVSLHNKAQMNKTPLIRFTSGVALILAWMTAGCQSLPRGVTIDSHGKTHVDAHVSDLHAEDFPALARFPTLSTVYFYGQGATDEQLKALAQLRFTNLGCVVFTDCPRVTDQGIEYLSHIPTMERFGLRRMSITDAACETMAAKMHLLEVNMPDCTNVTVNGMLKLARSESMESLGFSVGRLTQEDLIQIISTAGPQLGRMDIDLDGASEGRLDFPALRQAAKAKKIRLFAVRKKRVSQL